MPKAVRFIRVVAAPISLLLCILAWSVGATSKPAPDEQAVKAYRAYVAAIRSGSAPKALELIQPVPQSMQSILVTYVDMRVAVEAVKNEIDKQFHPPPPNQGDTIMGEMPDEWLKDVVGERVDDQTVKLTLKDPKEPDIESPIGFMIRRDDKWLVPASMVLGLEPSPKFTESPASEREALTKVANAWRSAAKTVSAGLEKHQYKSAKEAQDALRGEFGKLVGPP